MRENRGGNYYTLVYSRVCAAHIDPIEKKPFFHFPPGTHGVLGGHGGLQRELQDVPELGDLAVAPRAGPGQLPAAPGAGCAWRQQYQCPSIAYTYSEPVVFYEYVLDAAQAGRAAGVKSVVVSGGYIQQDPLRELCKRVDAVKVDLKAFSEKFYKEVVNGELKPVLDALVTIRKLGMWTEIVYLVIPTLNDSDERVHGPGPLGQDGAGPGRAAALLAVPSRVPAEEPAADARCDAGARQGHLRRRGPALRLHGQRPRPSRREHATARNAGTW